MEYIKSKYGFKTTIQRSNLMSKIHSKDTKVEIKFRKYFWHLGFRYRKNYKKLIGSPDIVFLKQKVIIFIDGEFWHGYNWEEKKLKIKSNKKYWINKIEKNMMRDKNNTKNLENDGWVVLRFWEQEIKKDFNSCVEKVLKYLISHPRI